MAADTNIFTDKQTNNWFKACISLNLTKDGLTDFVVTELLNVQTIVGRTELWATDPWEIGKCYLPRDGYSSHSLELHAFPDMPLRRMPRCPLEKSKRLNMCRDVRHTADCKVTDADLQYFFLTLTTLLADPLQNDRLSLDDLGKLLKEANQTLTQAKEAGEHFSEEAVRTLKEGLNTLEAKILAGEQRLKNKAQAGEQSIENKTQAGEKIIENKTQESIIRINQAANEKELDEYEQGVAGL
ncbi:hypothetical protein DPMN_034167 [Dreissena polymorpha]|uniref:Uncharacterized protein n=1 Tax=Dreissena polymorpha TaxID=45954 RepID=A0A9D4RKN1_DREPO|nr:hypothetical protein DPMN_034167 [Dreissena polymorpha]